MKKTLNSNSIVCVFKEWPHLHFSTIFITFKYLTWNKSCTKAAAGGWYGTPQIWIQMFFKCQYECFAFFVNILFPGSSGKIVFWFHHFLNSFIKLWCCWKDNNFCVTFSWSITHYIVIVEINHDGEKIEVNKRKNSPTTSNKE